MSIVLTSEKRIKILFSVCSLKDLDVWKISSKLIVKNIKSQKYIVIVPDNEVKFFTNNTDKKFQIKPESLFIGKLREILKKKIPKKNYDRLGWYLQQFIKFSALKKSVKNNLNDDIVLIWDADTVPLKKLNFINSNNKITYYLGKENHILYFDFIKKFLGLDKIVKFSFIAQCFPIKVIWIKEFFKYIENRHKKNWLNAFVDSINFNERTGLSEYETLGTFISHKYKEHFTAIKNSWLRNGNGLIGAPTNLDKFPFLLVKKYYDFISFELSDVSFRKFRKLFKRLIPIFLKKFFLKKEKNSIDNFLTKYFQSKEKKYIIQVGANDGIQNDPIRKFLKTSNKYKAILIEPIPYYFNKLKLLYKKRKDIKIINVAVGARNKKKKLYFIPPKVADQMNGDGPFNNWAHGQGSFNLETVIYWIKKNIFRGKKYREKIPYFISSIDSINVKIIQTKKILSLPNKNLLLILDVQGYELEVLKGIDWKYAPKYIMLEDDRLNSNKLIAFMTKKNFNYLCGTTDKIFINRKFV